MQPAGLAVRFVRRIWTAWTALLSRRESGTAIALFRIALGTTVLASVGRTVVAGLAPAVWLDARDGGWLPLEDQSWLIEAMGGLSPATMWTLVGMNIGLALCVIVGFGGRCTALLLSQSFLALSFINIYVQGCDDKLISNALWLLVLSRSTATLSLDCRLRTGRWTSQEPIPAWPRYLVIWQIILVYCTTGLQKVSITWTAAGDYSALFYFLQEPTWKQWEMSWLAHVYPLTQFATALTWWWETTFPVVLLAMHYRRTAERSGRLRRCFNRFRVLEVYAGIGVVMHLSVWTLFGLGPFTWVSLSCYFCLFPAAFWDKRLNLVTDARQSKNPKLTKPNEQPSTSRLVNVLVALHVVAVTLAAFPSPSAAMNADLWQTPAVQAEFDRWSETLDGWGVNMPPDELESFLWRTASVYDNVRQTVLKPFTPYYKYLGTRQNWPMFTGPDTQPLRIVVEIEEAGRWRTVFVQADPQHDWLGRQLNHEHGRTAWFCVADEPDSEHYRAFAKWIAERARVDFPRARRVRISTQRLKSLTPAEVLARKAPSVKVIGRVEINLGEE